ncbi:hypothetical protein ACRAWF_28310 [Streptomyces sp. L7]
MTAGRFYDSGDIARHDHVVVLGDQAAKLLGIKRVEDAPAVFFKGQSYTVIGRSRRDPARTAAVHRRADSR